MFRKLYLIILVIFVFITLLPLAKVNAQTVHESRFVRVVTISPEEEEKKSFYPVWGEIVEVKGVVNGDVYAVGEEILVQGIVNGDVIAAAGNIVIEGEIRGNLRAVAENIRISGIVEKNVTVAAGFTEMTSDSLLNSGIIAFGNGVRLSGLVKGDLKIFSQQALIESEIGSDAEVWSERIILENGAKLHDLTYHSENQPDISSQATISGKLIKGEGALFSAGVGARYFSNSLNNYFNRGRLFFKLLSFVWAIIWGLFMLRYFPKMFQSFTESLSESVVKSVFVGLGIMILVPILSIILIVTIIGIPFGLFLFFVFIIFSYFAKITFSYWLGRKLIKEDKKLYLSLVVGLLIYYFLGYVGFLGLVFMFIVYLTGLGGEFRGLLKYYSVIRKKNIL